MEKMSTQFTAEDFRRDPSLIDAACKVASRTFTMEDLDAGRDVQIIRERTEAKKALQIYADRCAAIVCRPELREAA